MKRKTKRALCSLCLTGSLTLTALMGAKMPVYGAGEARVDEQLSIVQSEIKQLLTEDLELPGSIEGLEGAKIYYSLENVKAQYASIQGNILKVTRPYAGEGNYSFVLKAVVEAGEKSYEKSFPLTIAEGVSDDTKAGYVYACFGNVDGSDVQQLHLFLSQDGLNWTALNGFRPIFETGRDYADLIQKEGTHNYVVKSNVNPLETTRGDASVLFPFEGNDQGIRDPYIIRGARASDREKVWILATDLNTMASKYGGNLAANEVGNWGTMSTAGSTRLFVYETEDWVNWERRYIDVGAEIDAGAAWAPEAVYNPQKDNYLVYWSCRVSTDGSSRNRLYCNETKDFKTFGPTKLYEAEAFYQKWGSLVSGNDGYGNIDTSQLWVEDKAGNPYGTLYRVVKDETDNHIELMGASTVLDPTVDYDSTEPKRITPYILGDKSYSTSADLYGLNDYQRAEVVYNWFEKEITGNHFRKISQKNMEIMKGAYEGATMFKFNDREEWCVMIDYYGSSAVRYEPYTTTDLSVPDSITKVSSGYGRTGGDVGCHGGMIPVTAEEYNRLIDTYNVDPTVGNYHKIAYIENDKRELRDIIGQMRAQLADGKNLSHNQKKALEESLARAEAMDGDKTAESRKMQALMERVNAVLHPVSITLSESQVNIKAGASHKVAAVTNPDETAISWSSKDENVAVVKDGMIKGVSEGSTFVIAKAGKQGLAMVQVFVE